MTLMKPAILIRRAAAACTVLILSATPTFAGPGHDHRDAAAPATSGNAPKRQPDGSVFFPKAAQRQINVRTAMTQSKPQQRAVELVGKVVMDPNAGGRVQALQAGRIQAGPKDLPTLGQRVTKGEVLAYVVPAIAAVERANQSAQNADLRAQLSLAEKRLARVQQLDGTVPQKDIDAARIEVDSLKQRVSAVGASLVSKEALTAPVSGVISQALAVTGQVVDARELVFEIVDPKRLRVEAVLHDTALALQIKDASIAVGDKQIELQLVGVGGALRDQTLPVVFRTTASADRTAPPLAVGQALNVVVRTGETVPGIRVPVAAIVKNPGNQDIVWLHARAELFVPKVVTFVPLDGTAVAVTSGLDAGQRVVTQGATLLNQVR